MEGASQTLILSVIIAAQDRFSAIMRNLGLAAEGNAGLFKTLQMGAVGVAAGIVAIGAAANHYASDFQTQFAKISGLTGSSADMIKYYKQQILELSPTFDMTATDASKALYFIISAGFSGAKAMDILRYSSMSANASLADQATVADALTSMLNA